MAIVFYLTLWICLDSSKKPQIYVVLMALPPKNLTSYILVFCFVNPHCTLLEFYPPFEPIANPIGEVLCGLSLKKHM